MKKTTMILLACLLMLIPLFSSFAEDEMEFTKDWGYILLDDDTAEIVYYSGPDTDVIVIPDTLNGKTVSAIGGNLFTSRPITSVTIPDSVTRIEANPFSNCELLTEIHLSENHPALELVDGVLFSKADKRLISYPASSSATSYTVPDGTLSIGAEAFFMNQTVKSIILPEGLVSIEDRAFRRCRSLTAVEIPDSVTQIGVNPFAECYKLTSIKVSPDHPYLACIGGMILSRPDMRLVSWPCGLEVGTVPPGTTEIGDCAFAGCQFPPFSVFTIPEGVTRIGEEAFEGSTLHDVVIPDSVTFIGKQAFSANHLLHDIRIPAGVTRIEDYAFGGCQSLQRITIPGSVKVVGSWVFYWSQGLEEVTVMEGVTEIGNGAFAGCESLQSVILPESLEKIGAQVFLNCSPTVTVPEGSLAEKYCIENGLNTKHEGK